MTTRLPEFFLTSMAPSQPAHVVVVGDDAFVFYFTHPGRTQGQPASDSLYAHRRDSFTT